VEGWYGRIDLGETLLKGGYGKILYRGRLLIGAFMGR